MGLKATTLALQDAVRSVEAEALVNMGANTAIVLFINARQWIVDKIYYMSWAQEGLCHLGGALMHLQALMDYLEAVKIHFDKAKVAIEDIADTMKVIKDLLKTLVEDKLLLSGPALELCCPQACALWCEMLWNQHDVDRDEFKQQLVTVIGGGELLKIAQTLPGVIDQQIDNLDAIMHASPALSLTEATIELIAELVTAATEGTIRSNPGRITVPKFQKWLMGAPDNDPNWVKTEHMRDRLLVYVHRATPVYGALRDLYYSAGGAEWKRSDLWCTSEDPSAWFGITMCPGGTIYAVKELDLAKNGLVGTIVPSIGDLPTLTHFYANRNRLHGAIPDTIGKLAYLEVLDFSSLPYSVSPQNQFTGPIPDTIGGCIALRSLNLEWNKVRGELPASLGNCLALEEMNLRSNRVAGIVPASLGNCTQLRKLSLDCNHLEGEIPESIGHCVHLFFLDLSCNRFCGLVPSSLGLLQKLQFLDMRWNKLSGSLPPELGECKSLRRLVAGSNQFVGTIPEAYGQLRDLLSFQAPKNKLSGGIPSSLFAKCEFLEELKVQRNVLSGEIAWDALATCKHLRELSMFKNQFHRPFEKAKELRSILGPRTRINTDSERWCVIMNPHFDPIKAKLRPSKDNTEVTIARASNVVFTTVKKTLPGIRLANGRSVKAREVTKNQEILTVKRYIELTKREIFDIFQSKSDEPVFPDECPKGGLYVERGESFDITDSDVLQVLQQVEFQDEWDAWKFLDPLPQTLFDDIKVELTGLPASTWFSRQKLGAKPDDSKKFADLLTFQTTALTEVLAKAVALKQEQKKRPSDENRRNRDRVLANLAAPQESVGLSKGGRKLTFGKVPGGSAIAIAGIPFPKSGTHSVTLVFERASPSMAVGVLNLNTHEELQHMLPVDDFGWIGATAGGWCVHNATPQVLRFNSTTIADVPQAIEDGSVVTITVVRRRAELIYSIDGKRVSCRRVMGPLFLSLTEVGNGGTVVRILDSKDTCVNYKDDPKTIAAAKAKEKEALRAKAALKSKVAPQTEGDDGSRDADDSEDSGPDSEDSGPDSDDPVPVAKPKPASSKARLGFAEVLGGARAQDAGF
jgi:hypothetical protein